MEMWNICEDICVWEDTRVWLCMCGYVYVYVYIRMYVCMCVCMCMCVCVCVCVYMCVCVCVRVCVCAWGHVYMCIDTRGCVPDTCGCAMAYMSHVPLDTLYLTLLFTPSSPLHQNSNT